MCKIDIHKNHVLFKKGQYIIKEGNTNFGLYFINQGRVKVMGENLNGINKIVQIAGKDHFIIHSDLGDEVFPIRAVAIEDSLVSFIDEDGIH